MGFNPGDTVYYRMISETRRSAAGIVSFTDSEVVLRLSADAKPDLKKGEYIVISTTDGDVYTEVESADGADLRLRRIWGEKREYFRIDDVIPLQCCKVPGGLPRRRARIVAGYGTGMAEGQGIPDEIEDPALWKTLAEINAKLSLILQHLQLEQGGYTAAEDQSVNLSASGMRFTMKEPAMPGDTGELKFLLPSTPPVGIHAYGDIVRVREAGDNEFEVSVRFAGMDEEVRDEIIQYALKRQRDLLNTLKQQSGNNG